MRFSSALSLAFLATTHATPTARLDIARATKPPAFFLAGDSTTATHGGWGDGFLELLTNGAMATNFGKSGASTYSFMHTGHWDDVLEAAAANNETYRPYITIQVSWCRLHSSIIIIICFRTCVFLSSVF